jgi:hypothetical protein
MLMLLEPGFCYSVLHAIQVLSSALTRFHGNFALWLDSILTKYIANQESRKQSPRKVTHEKTAFDKLKWPCGQ